MLKYYLPVLISTLCRYDHFKRTVASLQKCKHASESELFIALDYPKNESHVDGFNKIKSFLPEIAGFKKVNIIYREENYGSRKNIKSAMQHILEKFDAVIYLEDDNEVSPCFLDYMNKAFDRYADDHSIFAICGYSYFDKLPHDENTYYRHKLGCSVWGFCLTKSNFDKLDNIFTRTYCVKKLLNPISLMKIINHSWGTFLFMVLKVLNPSLWTDNTMAAYMFLEKKEVIMPIMSLIRNIGYDGSGEHSPTNHMYAKRKISEDFTFEFVGSGYEHNAEICAKLLKGKRQYISFFRMCSVFYSAVKHRVLNKINNIW